MWVHGRRGEEEEGCVYVPVCGVCISQDCFGVGARQQLTPAVGSLGWVYSGISRLAEAQGPPRCSDVTNSSRECFTFLFLAVVRSFPASRGKNTVGSFSGAFGSKEWKEPKNWDGKHMVVLKESLHLSTCPSLLSSFPENIERVKPPPTLPFTLSKNHFSSEQASLKPLSLSTFTFSRYS